MKNKTIIWAVAIGVVGFATYQLYFSKSAYAKTIVKNNKYSGGVSQLLTFDMAFLRAWSRAAKRNEESFSYKGKTYNTQGGRTKA